MWSDNGWRVALMIVVMTYRALWWRKVAASYFIRILRLERAGSGINRSVCRLIISRNKIAIDITRDAKRNRSLRGSVRVRIPCKMLHNCRTLVINVCEIASDFSWVSVVSRRDSKGGIREEEEARGGIRRRRSNLWVSNLLSIFLLFAIQIIDNYFKYAIIIFCNINYFELCYNLNSFVFYRST